MTAPDAANPQHPGATDLARLRKAAEAVSPKDWTYTVEPAPDGYWWVVWHDPEFDEATQDPDDEFQVMARCESESEAAYIAAADPPTILALLDHNPQHPGAADLARLREYAEQHVGPMAAVELQQREVTALLDELEWRRAEGFPGDPRPCYYCGELTEPLAGNPSRWPITLCHSDEPGRPKQHHVGCVSQRLARLEAAEAALARAECALDAAMASLAALAADGAQGEVE